MRDVSLLRRNAVLEQRWYPVKPNHERTDWEGPTQYIRRLDLQILYKLQTVLETIFSTLNFLKDYTLHIRRRFRFKFHTMYTFIIQVMNLFSFFFGAFAYFMVASEPI